MQITFPIQRIHFSAMQMPDIPVSTPVHAFPFIRW
jgi:hypothetical protein